MVTRYSKLCELKIFHEYYDAFTSKDFSILPSHETSEILRSFGIIFKQTNYGLLLIYSSSKEDLIRSLRDKISLIFCLQLNNKYFYNFSNLNFNSENEKYFFSSRTIQSENSKSIKLHSNPFISESDISKVVYEDGSIANDNQIFNVFIEQDGKLIFAAEVSDTNRLDSLFLNGIGQYDFSIDNETKRKILFLPRSLRNVFSVIEISLSGGEDYKSQIGREYELHFERRRIKWNYYFITEKIDDVLSIDIFSGKEKLNFTLPMQVSLLNSQQALKVSSEDAFPVQFRNNGKSFYAEIRIKGEEGINNRRLNLISPDVTRVKARRENGETVYFSEMYVSV